MPQNRSLRIEPEWMDMKSLTHYACFSERTAREWMQLPVNPLPAVRVGRKLLFRRSDIDRWLEGHRLPPSGIKCIVQEIVENIVEKS